MTNTWQAEKVTLHRNFVQRMVTRTSFTFPSVQNLPSRLTSTNNRLKHTELRVCLFLMCVRNSACHVTWWVQAKNCMLGKAFGPKEGRVILDSIKLLNKHLHNLYCSQNITKWPDQWWWDGRGMWHVWGRNMHRGFWRKHTTRKTCA